MENTTHISKWNDFPLAMKSINTWHPAHVDANGKEIPWVDRDGNVLKTTRERSFLRLARKSWRKVPSYVISRNSFLIF
jgi:hypothetical protein